MKLWGKDADMPPWLKYILGGVGGALLAGIPGIWINYSDFRAKRLGANTEAVDKNIETGDELNKIVDKFVALSRGVGEVSQADRDRLHIKLREAYQRGIDIRNRWGGLDDYFSAYAGALVKIKDGADNMTSPLDGKQFFKAYATFIVADEKWRQQVQKKQNSYFASF